MWYEKLDSGASWASLWAGLTICEYCGGICPFSTECPVCRLPVHDGPTIVVGEDGCKTIVSGATLPRAEAWGDSIYLQIIEREWKRSQSELEKPLPLRSHLDSPQKASVVILFWTYFETKIDRLLRASMNELPEGLTEDVLGRYSGIESRLTRLYKSLFGATYYQDLIGLGYRDVAEHIKLVRQRRNRFTHGDPFAIDMELISAVVANLKREHDAWISAFNKRATKVELS